MATVTIAELRSRPLAIPFTQSFRHASAERMETASLWVEVTSTTGRVGVGESCPRRYVTGETLESAQSFIAAQRPAMCEEIFDADSLRAWVGGRHEADLDEHPAAWCAVELALWDLLGREADRSVESLLGLAAPTGRFHYTAVLGDMSAEAFEAGVARYVQAGFTDFKVKLSGETDADVGKIATLRSAAPGARVRVDANNLWRAPRKALDDLQHLGPVFAVEEPLPPDQYGDLAHLAEALDTKIVLDESLLRVGQLADLRGSPDTWLINIRVSKMGGLLRSLAVVDAARAAGLHVIVGAQVGETSLLTRAGLTVAQAARDILVAQEGAFGTHLLKRDVCDPPLMFGEAGVLDADAFPMVNQPGWGLGQVL